MPSPIFSTRARISAAQAEKLLKCYAARMSPREAARKAGLSLNSVYIQYERIRWRLIIAGYYRDGANSPDEAGLAPELSQALRARKGIPQDQFYAHAAEVIHWAEAFPTGLTLKHLRKVIELTGPLDSPPMLTEGEAEKLIAYVRYARTELVYDAAKTSAAEDAGLEPYRDRAKAALDSEWRGYRAASKALERNGVSKPAHRRNLRRIVQK